MNSDTCSGLTSCTLSRQHTNVDNAVNAIMGMYVVPELFATHAIRHDCQSCYRRWILPRKKGLHHDSPMIDLVKMIHEFRHCKSSSSYLSTQAARVAYEALTHFCLSLEAVSSFAEVECIIHPVFKCRRRRNRIPEFLV
jgi:hypothetical protein